MGYFPNDDDSARPPPDPDRPVPPYRANIIFQGRIKFVICLNSLNYHQFIAACQQLLRSQLGITRQTALWYCSISGPDPTRCKVKSDVDLRHVFAGGNRSGGETIIRNFVVVCEPSTSNQGKNANRSLCKQTSKKQTLKKSKKQTVKKQPCTKKLAPKTGKTLGLRAFRLLELEAGRSRNLQTQLRLLNRAFKQILPRTAKNTTAGKPSVVYERRRRQFATMLVTIQKRPQRASVWLRRMQHQHRGNVRMLRILSILHIFINISINNLLRNNDVSKKASRIC